MIYFENNIIIVWFLFSFIFVILLLLVSYLTTAATKEEEKLTAYECGFDPFGSSKKHVDVNFFLVGILFLLFDIEIAYLLPLVLIAGELTVLSFICFLVFFWVILLGFIYEWEKGTLSWIS